MKKVIFFVLLLAIGSNVLSQQTNTKHPLTKQDYLSKSKRQKSAGWALLGGGTALIGVGFLIGDRKESSFDDAGTGVVLGGLGFIADVISIPVFLASGKNKRRGMAASASLKMQSVFAYQKPHNCITPFPAIALNIRL